jgi:carbamoyl-phosphate synthase large subunit
LKKILILGASDIHLPVIEECRRLGHRALVADIDPEAPGLRIADVPLVLSTDDVDGILAAARAHAIDGILTTSDYPVRTVARVCRELGLHGLSEASAAVSTDKFLQRKLLRSCGLPCPDFALIASPEQLPAVERMALPVIVKPVDSSASRGVSRVDDCGGLRDAYELARSYSRNANVIAEEFISGPEFSVEVLVEHSVAHIVAVTEKATDGEGERFFVETRHIVPAPLSDAETEAIHAAVRSAIAAVGLNNCASHTEVKLAPQGPVIIEIAARLGGDYITSDLVPLATGVSMLENVIRMAIGEPIDPAAKKSHVAGIRFVTPENHARAKEQLDRLRGDSRVHRMQLRPKPRDAVLRSSLDRLGYCIAWARTRQELLAVLNFEGCAG